MINHIAETREIIMAGDTAYCLIRLEEQKKAYLILCDEDATLEELLSLEEGLTEEQLAACEIAWVEQEGEA